MLLLLCALQWCRKCVLIYVNICPAMLMLVLMVSFMRFHALSGKTFSLSVYTIPVFLYWASRGGHYRNTDLQFYFTLYRESMYKSGALSMLV